MVTAKAIHTGPALVHTEIDAGGAAQALKDAEKIVIVPGYGLAVAQVEARLSTRPVNISY